MTFHERRVGGPAATSVRTEGQNGGLISEEDERTAIESWLSMTGYPLDHAAGEALREAGYQGAPRTSLRYGPRRLPRD